jgi:hypothetical protein
MCVMKSQVAITVSGHVFAYPTVRSVTTGSLLKQPAIPTTAQDASQPSVEAAPQPLWPIEFAAAA